MSNDEFRILWWFKGKIATRLESFIAKIFKTISMYPWKWDSSLLKKAISWRFHSNNTWDPKLHNTCRLMAYQTILIRYKFRDDDDDDDDDMINIFFITLQLLSISFMSKFKWDGIEMINGKMWKNFPILCWIFLLLLYILC